MPHVADTLTAATTQALTAYNPNWTSEFGVAAVGPNGAFEQTLTGAGGVVAFWSGTQFASNQFAQCNVGDAGVSGGGGYGGPAVRCSANGGYVINWPQPGSGNALYISLYSNTGSFSNLAAESVGPFTPGDVIRVTAVGSLITVYQNGVSVLSVSDSTLPSGAPGIGYAVALSGVYLQNWAGGSLIGPSSLNKWTPFELACRLHCLRQGSLNVGNTRQNIANLQTLCVANANGAANFAKWHMGNVNNTNPAQSLLVMPSAVPGFLPPAGT